MTPIPAIRHRQIVTELCFRLRSAPPPHLIVLPGPLAVALNVDTEAQPDVVVAPFADFTETNLPVRRRSRSKCFRPAPRPGI